MDKELIENIANALAVSEICPFANEDCIDNCHKHFSNWLDNHDKQIRADEIEECISKIDKLTTYYAGDKEGKAITPKVVIKEEVIKVLEQLKEHK